MLDPQARQLLDQIAALGLPPPQELGVAAVRANYRDRRQATQPPAVPMATTTDHVLLSDGHRLTVREYRPQSLASSPAPALMYLHGGGWTIGDIDTHDTLCRALAHEAGVAVFSVDYRLGPEHRFPAAVIDSDNAWQWLTERAASFGLDPSRLAVGGDSAGGTLATVVTIRARDRGATRPAFQLLIYPAADQRAGHDSHERNGEGYLLTRELMKWFREQYHADPSEYHDWRASPLLADDLSALPPALILLAGYDPLVDEGLAYAERLRAAGNRVQLLRFDDQIHGFITMGKVISAAGVAITRCAGSLRDALTP